MIPSRRAALSLVVAIVGLAIGPLTQGQPSSMVPREAEVRVSIEAERLVSLPFAATHIAVHWPGDADARISIAFSIDGRSFGPTAPVEPDEAGDRDDGGRTFGNLLLAGGATSLRLSSDRPLDDVAVVAFDDRAAASTGPGRIAAAAVPVPTIVSRAAWAADESLRFDETGAELWPPTFQPLQKIVIHHTAGANSDPDPAATVRSIYRYHAVTRGWGDIGYNFLIDEAGQIYQGRYSREYAPGEMPVGEDLAGRVVTGGHARDYNAGVVGIAMLGTLTDRDATPAARAALEWLLAWKAERHGLDPLGAGLYVNPVTRTERHLPNILGHRDVAATACPGGVFYATLPALRSAVAARIAAATGPAVDDVAPTVLSFVPTAPTPTSSRSITFGVVFSEPVTDLLQDDLSITGTPDGWSVTAVSGSAAVWTVMLTSSDPAPGPVGLSLRASGVVDLAGFAGPSDAVDSTVITWVPDLTGTVTRLSGPSRYETAAAISAATFAPGVPVAYIATGANFPDALAGSVAAAVDGGPLLLVELTRIPPAVAAELTRLDPGRIVVLGGPGVVSDAVLGALDPYTDGTITRLWGPDRYGTAAAVSAATFGPGVPVAYIATGLNFPDALTAAAAAGHLGGPLLLVDPTTIPSPTGAELARLSPGRIVVAGGPGVVSDAVLAALGGYTSGAVTRVFGADRYETAAAISTSTFAAGVPVVYVATGTNFPDALAGAAAAGRDGGPLLLVEWGAIPPAVLADLTRLAPGRIVVLGGLSVVSAEVEAALGAYLAP